MKIGEIWRFGSSENYFIVADMFYTEDKHLMGYHRKMVNPPTIGERALVTGGYGSCEVPDFVKKCNKVPGMIVRFDGSATLREDNDYGTIEAENEGW